MIDFIENLITADKSNKKFWSYVKSQRKENSGISHFLENGKTVTDPTEKANILTTQFSKAFSIPCILIIKLISSIFLQNISIS